MFSSIILNTELVHLTLGLVNLTQGKFKEIWQEK